MLLQLPKDVIPEGQFSERELLIELAIALYANGKISFGQARKLAGMDWFSFRKLLAERKVPYHYDEEDLNEDMNAIESSFA
ncbi:MAG: hypothetical protein CMN32_03505 [Saprospirales bacterium]|nr:hypothetical protein [Saprospirales bacterium]